VSPRVREPLTIEHVLLGFLGQKPMHGYEIHQRLAEPTGLGLIWGVKQGQIYALLDRLEAEGYVTATIEPQEGRPPRKVVQLTDQGRQAYLAWVTSPVLHSRDMRQDFLAKLFFALQAGPTQASGLIEAQRAICRGWLAGLRAHAPDVPDGDRYDWLVRRFRISQVGAVLGWLEVCERVISAGIAQR
jgi:PadR family transcriptional regulator AphA